LKNSRRSCTKEEFAFAVCVSGVTRKAKRRLSEFKMNIGWFIRVANCVLNPLSALRRAPAVPAIIKFEALVYNLMLGLIFLRI
jgi:hypothetical protein